MRNRNAIAAAALGAALSGPLAATEALTPQEQAGRRLYLEGVTPWGDALAALVGMGRSPIAGSAVACGNCHGADGKGRPESSVNPPEVTWKELTKPYGHAHATGRKHGAFDERSFTRAVNEGLDPAGNRLDWAMPRYALSRSDAAALIAYLKRLAAQRDPGIAERSLRIGTILPARGPLAPAAGAMRAALAAYVETVNRAGGIHQRTLELVIAGDYAEARRRFAAEPVFALVSPADAAQPGELGAFIEEAKLPAVGPFAAATGSTGQGNGLVFHVFAGLAEQAGVLVDFAARHSGSSPLRAAIVASGASPYDHAAQAVRRRCAARLCGGVTRIGWYAARFDAAAAVKTLKAERRQQLFFFGPEREFAQLLDEAGRAIDASWRPSVFAAGGLARAALAVRGRFGGDIFLAFPASPLDRSPGDAQAWRELRREFGLSAQHEAAQTGALAAATVLAEGLRRAGRDLSRAGFVQALESLNNFDPGGFASPVSYGPDRRIGALGAYVVAVERGGGIVPASAWMALDRP